MRYLLALLLLASTSHAAGTTISTTLTMTSPSALISGTGAAATISMTNGYFRNISGSAITGGTVNGATLASDSLIRAKVVFDPSVSPATVVRAFNVSSLTRFSTGSIALNGTFPPNPVVACTPSRSGTAQGVAITGTPTTSSITLYMFNTTSGAEQAATLVGCTID